MAKWLREAMIHLYRFALLWTMDHRLWTKEKRDFIFYELLNQIIASLNGDTAALDNIQQSIV